MKKILVTGGAGMIGLEVCKQLSSLNHEVILFDLGEQVKRVENYIPENIKIYYGSILDKSSLRSAIGGCDLVFHLGAMLGVRRTEADKLRCIEININGTKNVLDIAVNAKVKKIIFASSSEVYGEPSSNPIFEHTPTQGKTVYAVTKLAGEELCKAYKQSYGIDFTILRYFNCYGPFQTAQFVISKFINNVKNGVSPLINGDGRQVRSYTYVSDTAKATILSAFCKNANGETLNIGSGKYPISLNDLSSLIIKLDGNKNKLKAKYSQNFSNTDREKTREIYERFCDSTKAMELLNWSPEVSLNEGIKKVYDSGKIFDRWENLFDEQN